MHGRATFSPDGRYRYRLARRWAPGPRALWVMLNPSTADADTDDPTIRRCIGFSRHWGFGALEVVNLFALRATEPALVAAHPDAVGPDNDAHLRRAAARADTIIAAWGAFAFALPRVRPVMTLLPAPVLCLGLTRAGHPRHPLYAPRSARPVPLWPGGPVTLNPAHEESLLIRLPAC